MQLEEKIRNIVFVGVFNHPFFDKYFVIKNNIVSSEEEILEGSVFDALGGGQLITDKFSVTVLVNQIIINESKPSSYDDLIIDVARKIISGTSKNAILGLGFNFSWFLEDKSKSLSTLSKEYFYNDKLKVLNSFFNSDDSAFGLYASSNYKNARLKFEAKPSLLNEVINGGALSVVGINFAFNFHFDIKETTSAVDLLNNIDNYKLYKSHSEDIISLYKK